MYHVIKKEGVGMPVLWIGLESLQEVTVSNPIIGVVVEDWNRYLSPWRAKKVFRKGEDFAGEAQVLLDALQQDVIAKMDCSQGCIICGYSLAGLFALWASHQTDVFTGCVCASGSLWYDNTVTYCQTHTSACPSFYLSLGDREKLSKNEKMRLVEEKTNEIVQILSKEHRVKFEMNSGNHFTDTSARCEKGIRYLTQQESDCF